MNDGGFSFEKVFESKLPILVGQFKTNDAKTFSNIRRTVFYDHYGNEQNLEIDMSVFKDMQTMHGIDVEDEFTNIMKYELEASK